MIEIIKPVGEVIKRLEEVISLNKSRKPTKTLTLDEFLKRPLPHMDIPKSASGALFENDEKEISGLLKECAEILECDDVTNCTRMEANTQLPWHTNSDNEGYRIYYIKGKGVFKYLDENGNQQLSYDDPNDWTCRKFKIVKEKPFWHSAYAEETRFAFGFGCPVWR